MSECDFHNEYECEGTSTRRVLFDMIVDEPRVQHLCDACAGAYSDSILFGFGPIDPRSIPEEHRSRTLNRFIPKIDFPDDDELIEECWEWNASVDGSGYGQFRCDGTVRKAHQYAFERFYGVPAPTIEDDEEIMHKCNNRVCTNPTHLWLGTRLDNLTHAVESGSFNRGLSLDTAWEIRRVASETDVTQVELAEEYGVCQQAISQVLNYETYNIDTSTA